MEKFSESSGLGISLEANSGHHYIRSVLPEGPVGRCGKLFSGDELLEVGPYRCFKCLKIIEVLGKMWTFSFCHRLTTFL